MRSPLVLFAAMLMCSLLFASNVTIRVLDNWNTPLYGTPVELLQKSVVAARADASREGYASMEVQDGEYVARVSRAGYPVFVSVLKVQGKTDVTLTAIQGRSYSVLYGTVQAEGGIPEGMKLYAMRNGAAQSSARVYGGGAYVLQFLEDGEYELVAGGEYEGSKFPFSVSGSETKLMDVNLKKEGARNASGAGAKEKGIPFVSVLGKGALYAPIKVKVGAGSEGAVGAQVEVLTPDGKVSLLTDGDGVAVINAAREGKYVFTYMGAQATVEIAGEKKESAASDAYAQQLAQEQAALEEAAAAQRAAQQKQADANAAILFGVGVLALVAVVILVGAYFFMKREKAQGHTHPGMREHSHAGGHAQHEHGERAHSHAGHAHSKHEKK